MKKSQKHRSCRNQKWKYPKLLLFEGLLALNQLSSSASLQSSDYVELAAGSRTSSRMLLPSHLFCPPSFFEFASQTDFAFQKAMNSRNMGSGYFCFYVSLYINRTFPPIRIPSHFQLSEKGNWLCPVTGIWLQQPDRVCASYHGSSWLLDFGGHFCYLECCFYLREVSTVLLILVRVLLWQGIWVFSKKSCWILVWFCCLLERIGLLLCMYQLEQLQQRYQVNATAGGAGSAIPAAHGRSDTCVNLVAYACWVVNLFTSRNRILWWNTPEKSWRASEHLD